MEFEKLIGKDFEKIKSDFKSYKIENNDFELELEEGFEKEFYINAEDESFEMILTKNKIIHTIFIYPNESGEFSFADYNINMGKTEIRKRFGNPNKKGGPMSNSIIGVSGGFDRFDREISYHFEYADENQTKLKKITLMSLNVAP
ncbi:hypothetical protein TD3509T_500002 [Tenacibaculum dicentrarchi]|uniref:DUF1934 domain-containing protein n=1 Tax=Tenacibaculum dicentrarchi TaxID=669041 RepID=A0ABM9NXB1_9FLAO|nr:hypothetical protein TD3509T_500002 [Tenacibaculum dicentrarchi]